jgi:hypothetical protein
MVRGMRKSLKNPLHALSLYRPANSCASYNSKIPPNLHDLCYKFIVSAKLLLLPVASSSFGSPENLPWHFESLDQQGLTEGDLKAEIEKARGDIPNRKTALAHQKPKSSRAETAKEARNTEHLGQQHNNRVERITPIENDASDEITEDPEGALLEAISDGEGGE